MRKRSDVNESDEDDEIYVDDGARKPTKTHNVIDSDEDKGDKENRREKSRVNGEEMRVAVAAG